LVKVVRYPAGIGLGTSIIMDAVSREYDLYKFDKIFPELQKESIIAGIELETHVMDLCLSPAKAFCGVPFSLENKINGMTDANNTNIAIVSNSGIADVPIIWTV